MYNLTVITVMWDSHYRNVIVLLDLLVAIDLFLCRSLLFSVAAESQKGSRNGCNPSPS